MPGAGLVPMQRCCRRIQQPQLSRLGGCLIVYQPLIQWYIYLPTPPLGQDMTQGQF